MAIGVALVVVGEGFEEVGALGGEASEGGDAGEGKLCLNRGWLLVVSCLARCFVGRIPSCVWISQSRTEERLKHYENHAHCTVACKRISPFSMGALGIYYLD